MKIRKMSVKLCTECYNAFFGLGDACNHCGSLEKETFWTDDDGDYLFKLVSDASDQTEKP